MSPNTDGASSAPRSLRWYAMLLVAAVIGPLGAQDARAVRRPHYGGELRVVLTEPVTTIDPAAARSFGEWLLVGAIHRGLYEAGPDGPRPALLEAPLEAQGGMYRGRLRADARFHDGAKVRARDVVRSFERLARTPWSWVTRGVQVQATGGRGLAFRVDPALAENLENILASPALSIVRQRGAVGTGPFRVRSAPSAGTIRLDAFLEQPAGRPYLDAIEVRPGLTEAAAIEALHYGRADLAFVDSERYRGVERVVGPYRETIGLLVQSTPGSDDARVRHQVAASVPRRMVSLRTTGRSRESVALIPHREGPDITIPRSGQVAGVRWFVGGPAWLGAPLKSLAAGMANSTGQAWPEQELEAALYRRTMDGAPGRWNAVMVAWPHVDPDPAAALRTLANFSGAMGDDPAAALRGAWLWIPVVDRARVGVLRGGFVGLEWSTTGIPALDGVRRRTAGAKR